MTRRPSPAIPRRGAIGLSMILLMVVLQLAVVGTVVLGARDQDALVQRVDASRAYYAAEAGLNMAIHELMSNTDDDGDGTIGTISNEANAGNDPLFTTAQVYVTRTTSGANTTLSCFGRAGATRALTTATVLPSAGSAFPRRVAYCAWPGSNPQTRTWNGATWSAAADTVALSAHQIWAVAERCPARTEILAGYGCQGDTLEVTTLSGSTWAAAQTFSANLGTTATRTFSLAYEQSSGDALVAYRNGNSPTICYRTWNGSAWSGQQSVASPLSGNPAFIKLIAKPGSDQIMLLVLDSNSDAAAMVWNGSAFSGSTTLETNAPTNAAECLDAAWETAGRCVVVWGQAGNNAPQYQLWGGSSWGSAASAPSVGAVPLWIHLASDPATSKVMMGCLDAASDINVNIWSGSAWGTDLEIEANAPTTASRAFDVAFEGGGTAGLVAWAGSSTSPRYRVYDGSAWGAQQSAPAISNIPLIVQLSPDSTGSTILSLFVTGGGQSALEFLRFTGSGFDSHQQLTSNASGPVPAEVFMIPKLPQGVISPDGINAYAQVAPQ